MCSGFVRFVVVCVVVCGLVGGAHAVKKADLSPGLQALVPDSYVEGFAVQVKSGRVYRGSVITETDEYLKMKYTQGTITGTVTLNKADIKATRDSDAGPYLVPPLLAFRLDEEGSQPLSAYREPIRLFLEFMRTCKGVKGYDEVQERATAYLREMARVSQGQERVGDFWYTPVQAAVRKYRAYGERIDAIERDRKFRSGDPELKAEYDALRDRRREAGRTLPKLTQDRAQTLVAAGDFLGAADEVNAFIRFWVDQVVSTEVTSRRGGNEAVFKQMDMQYLINIQREIMDAYRAKVVEDPEPPAGVVVPDDMVYVPGGFFLMGADTEDSSDDRFPLHLVYLAPYLMDKYEVSNAQYREFTDFVAKTRESWMEHKDAPPMKKHEPKGWAERSLSADNQPVVGVDWFDAYAYAAWRKKRLPTEAEWEKAARGPEGRVYPWGDTFGAPTVNYEGARLMLAKEMDKQNPPLPPDPQAAFGCSCFKQPPLPEPPPTKLPPATWEVDSQLPPQARQAVAEGLFVWAERSDSPYGLVHLAGNASEWVNDFYDAEYYAHSDVRNPQGPETGKAHVHRGGSFMSPKEQLKGTWRDQDGARRRSSARGRGKSTLPSIGFRCAQSLAQAEDVAADDPVADATLTELVRRLASHLR